MPLMYVIDVTATNQSFPFAFSSCSSKQKPDYLCALIEVWLPLGYMIKSHFDNRIQHVISIVMDREPDLKGCVSTAIFNVVLLFCSCYIEKMCWRNWDRNWSPKEDLGWFFALWPVTCRSATKIKYLEIFMLLHDKISEYAFDYLDTTWLIHKKRLCAWTKKSNILKHTVTSRVERGHAMIKKWIAVY